MVSTAVFIMVCASAAGLLGLCAWIWRGYHRACRMRACHHCGHQLTKFASGRIPWCPECGGLSGPRTRWKFVRRELRDIRVVAVAAMVILALSASIVAGPGVTWATRAGALGSGTMIWLCENSSGEFRAELIERLCAHDALRPLALAERRRLAALMLADAFRASDAMPQAHESAMRRFMITGALAMDQVQAYDEMVQRQYARVPKWKPILPPPPTGTQIVLQHYGQDWTPKDGLVPGGKSPSLNKPSGTSRSSDLETDERPPVVW